MKHVPTLHYVYTYQDVRLAVRRETIRCMLNAAVSLAVLLATGYLYAQLARKMGASSTVIGATAVGVQCLVGIFGMMARLGEHLVGVVKWVGRRKR